MAEVDITVYSAQNIPVKFGRLVRFNQIGLTDL